MEQDDDEDNKSFEDIALDVTEHSKVGRGDGGAYSLPAAGDEQQQNSSAQRETPPEKEPSPDTVKTKSSDYDATTKPLGASTRSSRRSAATYYYSNNDDKPLTSSTRSSRRGQQQQQQISRSERIGSVYRKSASGRIGVRRATITTSSPTTSPPPSIVRLGARNSTTGSTAGQHDDDEDATWGEVYRSCCCHTRSEWFGIASFLLSLLGLLYFFLVGLDLLGTSFKVAGGCTAGSLLGSDTNPMASLLIGIVATAILQSSSTTTAIIVSLVSGGLNVEQGIYMVMGANVGTAITAMLVSLAHMGDGEELERAFAGGSVYYVFNLMTLVILFPLEVSVHYLYNLTKAMLPSSVGEGEAWEGPIRVIVSPVVKSLIIANTQLIEDISTGVVDSCSSAYPVTCTDGVESYDTCNKPGVIACNEDTGGCPAFFMNGAEQRDDMVSGWVCLIIALFILIICLIGMVALLHRMLAGASTRIVYRATNINPYLAMMIGCGVTVLVQSSSITTSTLVPLAGVGVLKLENMYPLVIGADIGTTFTALMAAMVSSNVQSLQIALSHLFFNLTGTVIWYPIPFMRRQILKFARWLGKITRHWRSFPIFFICSVFFLLPLLLLGISVCFEQGTTGFTALGVFLVLCIVGGLFYFWFWWSCRDGKRKCRACITRRQRRSAAIQTLADDLDYLKVDTEWCKNEIGRIKEFAGQIVPSMEEGRPIVYVRPPAEDEEITQAATDQDELVSLYESCQSRPWRDVLHQAAGSIRSNLQGSARGAIGL